MNPRVSFVATSRNDDHGGNLLQRMQIFINGLAAQCDRHGLDAELILVEWNPPAERPRLIDALRWPYVSRCRIRVVEVPGDTHARFRHADALPLFQMIAKNVGIRRAQAPFVVATNVDVLFSDALIRCLASESLEDRLYRVDRYDVSGVTASASISDQLHECRRKVLRVCKRDGTYSAQTPLRSWLRWRRDIGRRYVAGLRRNVHGLPAEPPVLHTNASGDFTLLSRKKWFELRGYPELEAFSMNIDSIFCFAAHYAGAAEVVLPADHCIYHLEHSAGWTPEADTDLRQRVTCKGLPWIDWDQVLAWARMMERTRQPLVFNSENWGLAEERFTEATPASPRVYSAA